MYRPAGDFRGNNPSDPFSSQRHTTTDGEGVPCPSVLRTLRSLSPNRVPPRSSPSVNRYGGDSVETMTTRPTSESAPTGIRGRTGGVGTCVHPPATVLCDGSLFPFFRSPVCFRVLRTRIVVLNKRTSIGLRSGSCPFINGFIESKS